MNALITGGTRGIGLACCRLFSAKGYRVTALWSRDEAAARAAQAELPEVEFVRADVADEGAVARVLSRFDRLDALVNNAGVSLYAQVQDTSMEQFSRVMGVNAGGAFLTVKHAVRKMLSHGGAIVNVSSVWGVSGGSCESVYSASKGALIAFTKALARELAPSGITVNCVAPGVIDTAMNGRLNAEERGALAGEIPLGRFGTPEEVAEAVYFLATARYITGQTLGVDGGFC